MGRLDNKSAVITGGASGIGEATVKLFAAEGAKVILADIQDERGQKIADNLGNSVIFHHTDVSREEDIEGAVAKAVEKFGRLDCMFNNAGFGGAGGSILNITAQDYDATMAVLLRGVFLGIKHAARQMKKQGSGSIINTSSISALQGGYSPHPYCAAKGAIISLTRSTALELGSSRIRVNSICPGGIATAIYGGPASVTHGDEIAEAMKTALADSQPIKRAGLPEDIAHTALYLAGDESTFVSGTSIVVDGAYLAGRMPDHNNMKNIYA